MFVLGLVRASLVLGWGIGERNYFADNMLFMRIRNNLLDCRFVQDQESHTPIQLSANSAVSVSTELTLYIRYAHKVNTHRACRVYCWRGLCFCSVLC